MKHETFGFNCPVKVRDFFGETSPKTSDSYCFQINKCVGLDFG